MLAGVFNTQEHILAPHFTLLYFTLRIGLDLLATPATTATQAPAAAAASIDPIPREAFAFAYRRLPRVGLQHFARAMSMAPRSRRRRRTPREIAVIAPHCLSARSQCAGE